MTGLLLRAVLPFAALSACGGKTGDSPRGNEDSIPARELDDSEDPTPSEAPEHPRATHYAPTAGADYSFYEGTAGENQCEVDEDCLISGCFRSTCAAEVITIADEAFCGARASVSWPEPQLAQCGCIANECQWYSETDFDRRCEEDRDCSGLGVPPDGTPEKTSWFCVDRACHWGEPPR